MTNPLTQTQRRRQTAANWTSANPTLAAGEVGWESNTNKMKMGDGSTVWASLPYWASPAPTVKLFEFAVPIGIPSSGSIGNNGALTGITALAQTYSGGIYLYFPANAIAAGVAAGFYYCIMSSTTAGTIYNVVLSSGVPTVVSAPTAFATTGPGAYVQSTAAQTALTLAIAGNTIGATGHLVIDNAFAISNSAQAKSVSGLLGGSALYTLGPSAQDSFVIYRRVANRGVTNAQVTTSLASSAAGGAAVAPTYTAVDTTISQNFTLTLQLNATPASNWIVLEALRITLN